MFEFNVVFCLRKLVTLHYFYTCKNNLLLLKMVALFGQVLVSSYTPCTLRIDNRSFAMNNLTLSYKSNKSILVCKIPIGFINILETKCKRIQTC